jgi:hypothetical protein
MQVQSVRFTDLRDFVSQLCDAFFKGILHANRLAEHKAQAYLKLGCTTLRARHIGWYGELIQRAASLKLAPSSGDQVPDPFAFPAVGERNQESPRSSGQSLTRRDSSSLTFFPFASTTINRGIGPWAHGYTP